MSVAIDLHGRRALITGAASGIGRGCAERLAQAGAAVVIADVRRSAAEDAAAALGSEGADVIAVELDISDWDRCRSVVEDELPGPADILVNCAAVWHLENFRDLTPPRWRRDLEVTLDGTMTITRALLPGMIEAGGGAVVSISSDAARIGERQQVVYGAAKAGVIGFTKSLAREVGPSGIRVNCVAPGLTRTPASTDFIERAGEDRLARSYPLRRIGEPGDIADAVLFLVSDLSAWITGQVLSVSGGYTMVG